MRSELEGPWEQAAGELLADPWAARDDYAKLLLEDSEEAAAVYFAEHGKGELDATSRGRAHSLLELQRNALRMFTSCAWFFEDVSRIETRQVLRYAARALEQARRLMDMDREAAFLDRLAKASSSRAEEGNGRLIYERHVTRTEDSL